jgi:hypothetical protein
MNKDNAVFVGSLIMLPLLITCSIIFGYKCYRFHRGEDQMVAKSISRLSLALNAYWTIVTLLMGTTFYLNGYINWWCAAGIHITYIIHYMIVCAWLSEALRAQFPGNDIGLVRQI